MSDTPRTDDEQFGATGRVSVDFARTLERELTAAQARIAELEKRLTSSERARQSLSDACDSLQAEIRGIKAELSRTKLERDVEADAVTLLTQPKPAPAQTAREWVRGRLMRWLGMTYLSEKDAFELADRADRAEK